MTDERKPAHSRSTPERMLIATKCLPKKELPKHEVLAELSPAQLQTAQEIYEAVGEHLTSPSFEGWARMIRTDPLPDRQLLRWAKIATAFKNYRTRHAEVTDSTTLKFALILLVAASLGDRFPGSVPVLCW
jgi:hypothetical protein